MASRVSIITELLGFDAVVRGLDQIAEHIEKTGKTSKESSESTTGLSGSITGLASNFLKGALSAITLEEGIHKVAEITKESIDAFSEMERLTLRLEAVWKSTGGTSGVLTSEIIQLSQAISRTTFVTQEQVLSAATSLGTFRSISGDTFRAILKDAAGISTVMGRDFNTTVIQMGRALEGIANGAVNNLGYSFRFLSPAILKTVEEMAKAGDQAGATKLLLDSIAKAVGGAAEGEHTGLSGSVDKLTKSWKEFEQELGQWLTQKTGTISFLESIDTAIQNITGHMKEINAGTTVESLTKDIETAGTRIAKLMALKDEPDILKRGKSTAQIDKEIADLQATINKNLILRDTLRQTVVAQQQAAAAATEKAQAEDKGAKFVQALSDAEHARIEGLRQTAEKMKGPLQQAEDAYHGALQNTAKLVQAGVMTQAQANVAIREATNTHTEALRAIANHDRALAGLDLTIKEHVSDLNKLIPAQAQSGREFAIVTQLLAYETEQRGKGIAVSKEMEAALRKEAEANVELEGRLKAVEAIRTGGQEIQDIQALIIAQQKSNSARAEVQASIEAETKIRELNLDMMNKEDAALADSIRQNAQNKLSANSRLSAAADIRAGEDQIKTLQELIDAQNESNYARRQTQSMIDAENKIRSLNIDIVGEQADAIRKQAAEEFKLNEALIKSEQAKAAEIQGTLDVINEMYNALQDVGGALVDSLAAGEKPGKALLQTFRDILTQVAKLILQLGVLNPLMNSLFKDVEGYQQKPDLGGIFGKILGSLGIGAGAGAGGGVGSGTGMAIPIFGGLYAAGTDMVVSRPTMMIAGEAGEERVTITPKGQTRGGHNFYIDARGADRQGLVELRQMIRDINSSLEERAVGAVLDTHRRGGSVSDKLRA